MFESQHQHALCYAGCQPGRYKVINAEASGFTAVGSELIVSRSVFDFESDDTVTVKMSVSDNGTPIRTTIVSINVTIIDVNEAPSDIQLDSLEFYEDARLGDAIAQLTIVDPDNAARLTQKHVCRIADRHPSAEIPFRIEYRQGQHDLILASPTVDYERTQRYSLDIICTDDGVPPMKLQSSFHIRVLNKNEAPITVWCYLYPPIFFAILRRTILRSSEVSCHGRLK